MRIAAIAAGLLTLVGVLAAVPASGKREPAPTHFTVSGSVQGLYPGARRLMSVKVRNPYARAMRLVSVWVEVGRARRLCTGSNLDVHPFRGRLLIRAGRAATIRLVVRMQRTAAEQCKGARFPLRFRARAVLG